MASMLAVLYRAWLKPFSIKGQYARDAAFYVGILASEGMITTCVDQDVYGTKWLITQEGIIMKGELDEFIQSKIEQYKDDEEEGPPDLTS